jgi:hypothetical protein
MLIQLGVLRAFTVKGGEIVKRQTQTSAVAARHGVRSDAGASRVRNYEPRRMRRSRKLKRVARAICEHRQLPQCHAMTARPNKKTAPLPAPFLVH